MGELDHTALLGRSRRLPVVLAACVLLTVVSPSMAFADENGDDALPQEAVALEVVDNAPLDFPNSDCTAAPLEIIGVEDADTADEEYKLSDAETTAINSVGDNANISGDALDLVLTGAVGANSASDAGLTAQGDNGIDLTAQASSTEYKYYYYSCSYLNGTLFYYKIETYKKTN